MKKIEAANNECILIEGLREVDAEFYGKWLLAAAETDKLLERVDALDPTFRMRIQRLEALYKLQFGLSAVIFFEQLAEAKHFYTSIIDSDSLDAEMFCLMTELGFFKLNGARYQMTLPGGLDIAKVQNALLKFAATEDEGFDLHPERLVTCMLRSEAESLQRRIARDWTMTLPSQIEPSTVGPTRDGAVTG